MKKAIPIIIAVVLLIVIAVIVIPLANRAEPKVQRKTTIMLLAASTPPGFLESLELGLAQAVEGTDIEIRRVSPSGQLAGSDRQQLVDDLLAEGVAGIIFAACQPDAIRSAVQKACDANLPCVVVGCYVENEKLSSCVPVDNYIAGLMAARRMAEALNREGKVALLKPVPGTAWSEACANGFVDTIKNEFPEMRIVEDKFEVDTTGTVAAAVEDILAGDAEFDGLFTCESSVSLGVVKVLGGMAEANRPKVVAFGADPALVDALKSGTLVALVAQDPRKMGRAAGDAVISAIRGEEVEKRIAVRPALLTVENIDTAVVRSLLSGQLDRR